MERMSSKQQTGALPMGCRALARGNGEICVVLEGDIDHHRAAELRSYLDELICRDKPQRMYLDMARIEFMDSSGLGLIMGRYTLLGRLGGQLVFEHPSAAATRMIPLAAMERFINIVY